MLIELCLCTLTDFKALQYSHVKEFGNDIVCSFPLTSCNMAVVRQGREVVGVLSQAIQQLQVGNSRKSTALLRQLRNDASILSTETQDLLEQLHNVQDYYKGQVEVG